MTLARTGSGFGVLPQFFGQQESGQIAGTVDPRSPRGGLGKVGAGSLSATLGSAALVWARPARGPRLGAWRLRRSLGLLGLAGSACG